MSSPLPDSPLRPNRYVEKFLVTAILDGTFPAGTPLPSERSLARQLGVTRPPLRETLQRLAKDGWVVVRHGRPTIVNDYWRKGGLGMLGTLAKYAAFLPNGFITNLLQVRVTLLPPVARLAVEHHPQIVQQCLAKSDELCDAADAYTRFDWELQMTLVRHCANPIYALILNDFGSVFQTFAPRYFAERKARGASLGYYRRLAHAVTHAGTDVEALVREAMNESIAIWKQVKRRRAAAT